MTALLDLLARAGSTQFWLTIAVDSAIKGTLILTMAAALCVLLRRASPSVRHHVWALSVVALLAVAGRARVLGSITPLSPHAAAPHAHR